MPSRASAAPAFLYVPGMGSTGSEAELSDAESHYVARVCRARVGDRVHATDGEGQIATLRLAAVERKVRAIIERTEFAARPRRCGCCAANPKAIAMTG